MALQTLVVSDENGRFAKEELLDLRVHHKGRVQELKWLWAPLGYTRAEMWSGKVCGLALFKELRRALIDRRKKRTVKGFWLNENNESLPKLASVVVRGKTVRVGNACNFLILDIAPNLETLNWFLKQLSQDKEHPSEHGSDLEGSATDEEAEDSSGETRSRSPSPSPPSKKRRRTKAKPPAPLDQKHLVAISQLVEQVKAETGICSLSFDNKKSRFQIGNHPQRCRVPWPWLRANRPADLQRGGDCFDWFECELEFFKEDLLMPAVKTWQSSDKKSLAKAKQTKQ